MRATLTVTGLYNYDNTIFDGWTMPQGVDIAHLKDNILYECSGLELTLPNADLFKVCTSSWCRRKAHAWERALAAINAVYNPIHNYDRQETVTDAETGSSGVSGELSNTTEDKTAAFNTSTYAPKDKTTVDQDSESSATYGKNALHTITAKGNIGVTTSQKMINDELHLAENNLDIYAIITRDFKREFCLMVY